jgi:predicted Zn-dependent protease
MAQFFQKIEAEAGTRGAEFFSDHPNPGNRINSVNQEITKLGGLKQPNNDSADFQRIKRILKTK